MRRWMGVDLNGWRDWAFRDWNIEDFSPLDRPKRLDGGVGSVAIRTGDKTWVGGPQATLAPHGRGKGWGDIGEPTNRRTTRELIARIESGDLESNTPIIAVFEALVRHAERIMLTVPDHAAYDETVQGRILKSLSARGRARPQLLWRSVALHHGLRAKYPHLFPEDQIGHRTRLLIHGGNGLEEQVLRLVEPSEHRGHIAPERSGYGRLITPGLGLETLLAEYERAMDARYPDLAKRRCEPSRLPIRQLLGDAGPGDLEILRRDYGTWLQTEAIPVTQTLTVQTVGRWDRVDLTVLATPMTGEGAEKLVAALEPIFPSLVCVQLDLAAEGALHAARIMEQGRPHYVEKLDPIALAVQRSGEPTFEFLVPPDTFVPANREFVSRKMTGFQWRAGKDKIEFYVAKGDSGARQTRHWTIDKIEPPDEDQPVELQLRQMPGQSWAKLTVNSADWSALAKAPIELDWDRLEIDSRSSDEILQSLERPRPVVPERVLERADIGFWNDEYFGPSVEYVLRYERTPAALRKTLARQNRMSDGLRRPLSTDGEFPEGLEQTLGDELDKIRDEYESDIVTAMDRGEAPENSRVLQSLTWMQARCPAAVQDLILDALEADNHKRSHPFLGYKSATKILQQGAGRSISTPERVERLLELLLRRPKWTSDTRGALSFLLSRRENAPKALSRKIVSDLLDRLNDHLEALVAARSLEQDFKYTLSAIAGLLRFREIEPYALVADATPGASRLRDSLKKTERALESRGQQVQQASQKLAVVRSLLELLQGIGGDPNILVKIDEL